MKFPRSPTPLTMPAQPTPIADHSLLIIVLALSAALTAGAAIAQIQAALGF